jgi:ABC-2 type transport system permease protein
MVLYIVATIVTFGTGLRAQPLPLRRRPRTDTPLSDMNGQGKFWIGAWWFRLYWSAFAVVLLVLAYGLWRRGTETRLCRACAACPPA